MAVHAMAYCARCEHARDPEEATRPEAFGRRYAGAREYLGIGAAGG